MILWILWKRKRQRYGVTCKWSEETVSMKWRYGYAKYATMGALTGGLLVYGGLDPLWWTPESLEAKPPGRESTCRRVPDPATQRSSRLRPSS
jgi:hypothetical protein